MHLFCVKSLVFFNGKMIPRPIERRYFTEFKITIHMLYIPEAAAFKSSPEVISMHDNPIDSHVNLVLHEVTQKSSAGKEMTLRTCNSF